MSRDDIEDDDTNIDEYGFEDKSIEDLNKIVTDVATDSMDLQRRKKAYVSGINDVLKENKKRMEAAIEHIKIKRAMNTHAALENAAEKILSIAK